MTDLIVLGILLVLAYCLVRVILAAAEINDIIEDDREWEDFDHSDHMRRK